MTATDAPTLYDVLEVDPASSLDELREAVERARETYGPDSLAVYALVDEEQIGELRAKLDEAASVLLDPARRASYDRSIGRIGPSTLWAEDDDEEEEPLPPVEPGPHARRTDLQLETAPDDEAEEPAAPRQHALDLALTDTPGPFGQGPERPEAAVGTETGGAPVETSPSAPLLSGDWAAAVPAERQSSRAPTEPDRAVVTAACAGRAGAALRVCARPPPRLRRRPPRRSARGCLPRSGSG